VVEDGVVPPLRRLIFFSLDYAMLAWLMGCSMWEGARLLCIPGLIRISSNLFRTLLMLSISLNPRLASSSLRGAVRLEIPKNRS